jgi:hypothetical protein
VVVFVGAVAFTLCIRLANLIFPTSGDRVAIAEHLLGPIEERGSPLRLADRLPAIVSMPKDVRQAIRHAARIVGVDPGYLAAVAARESGFDPTARAEGSTAAGLFQFTADTWLRVVKVFGERYGLADEARQITIDSEGRVSVANAEIRTRLLQRRDDPRLSALMAAELGQDNKARLERVLGRSVTPAETYIAHFLGFSEAARMIDGARAVTRVSGVELLPIAAARNPAVFAPAGQAASAQDVVARINAYFDQEVPRFARM